MSMNAAFIQTKGGAAGLGAGADRHGSAVRGDLTHQVGDLAGVEPAGEYGVPAEQVALLAEPCQRLLAAVAQQLGVALGLAAEYRPEGRTGVAERVPRADDDAEHLTVDLDDVEPGSVVHRRDEDRR